MNGKVYTFSIEKGSSLPAREADLNLFQCCIMLFIIINMIHLSTFCYTRSRPVGILVIAWMRPYSSYRRVEFTGMLAMESSVAFSFWHAGQGVISCLQFLACWPRSFELLICASLWVRIRVKLLGRCDRVTKTDPQCAFRRIIE